MNSGTRAAPSWIRIASAALVAAAALAFGWPTLGGDFLSGDDQRFIVEHYLVNHPSLDNAAKLMTIVHDDLYQPLPLLSFQMDYARARPTPDDRFPVSPRVFHETNLLLHIACSVLAMLVATRLARCRRVGLLVGLMFACHPYALEPVAWINGRMILLATMFSLLTLLACQSGTMSTSSRIGPPAIGALVAWVAAVLSKVLPTVPIAALWADWRVNGRLNRPAVWVYGLLLAVSVAATGLVLAATQRSGFIEGVDAERTTSMPVHVLLAAGYYLRNYAIPDQLAAWSPPPEGIRLASIPAVIALVEVAIFAALTLIARRWNRTAYLGLVLFAILLSPFLFAGAGRRFLVADRYMYLPILGLHLAVAATAISLLDRLVVRLPRLHARVLVTIPILLMLSVWMTKAWQLAPTWRDTVSRDRRVAQVYSDSELAYAELAKGYNFQNDPETALEVVADARLRWPNSPRLAAAAGDAYRIRKDWSRAKDELQFAASHMPRHLITHYRLGQVYEMLERPDRARVEFEHVLQLAPDYLPAVLALARTDANEGRLEAAAARYERALAISPQHRSSRLSLAEILIRRAEWSAAEAQLRHLLRSSPDDAPVLLNLAVVLTQTGRADEAVAIYDELLGQGSGSHVVRVNRGLALTSLDRDKDAEEDFRAVLAEEPAHREAAIGLHMLLLKLRRYAELPPIWENYRAVRPNDQPIIAWEAWAYALTGQLDESGEKVQFLHMYDPFLGWAMAWEAIETSDIINTRRRLGPPEAPAADDPKRLQEMRAIMLALDGLPEEIKNAPIGAYALARAALHGGDISLAQRAVEQLRAMTSDRDYLDGAGMIEEAIEEFQGRVLRESTTSQSGPR